MTSREQFEKWKELVRASLDNGIIEIEDVWQAGHRAGQEAMREKASLRVRELSKWGPVNNEVEKPFDNAADVVMETSLDD